MRKKKTPANQYFSEFINLLIYNKNIEETAFFRFTEEDIANIGNIEEGKDIVKFIKQYMPYSFGFDMFFYEDSGYYMFRNMLNKAIGVEETNEQAMEDESDISQFTFILPINKESLMIVGEDLDEIDEILNKDKKEILLLVTIFKQSSLEEMDELKVEENIENKPKSNKRKSLSDLETELSNALKIEDYETCAKLQVKIDKIKNKNTKSKEKK
jgi:hypothetical protein